MSMRTRTARAVVVISLVGGLAAGIQPAHASYHEMKIREAFAGRADQPNAHFVELQMYSAGQNFVAGKQVKVFSAAGAEVGSFTFPAAVPNGGNQATILIGTAEVQTAFGVAPDLVMPTPVIAAAGGKACFFDPGDPYIGSNPTNIDCVSWGSFASGGDTGTPAPAIPQGMSIERKISGGSSPSTLDPADDTDNSAADFQVVSPSPQKNVVTAAGGDTTAPVTHIARPVRGRSYNDTRFKRFTGHATDAGSGLAVVEIALRQTLDNGCRWWNGSRFVRGACNKKKFKAATGLDVWKYVLSKRLAPSNVGAVRFYTLFARATDAAGNVESAYQKGRNANRFEIT
jgi:hypothetical protein